ncbi:MAG: aminoacyl-tRNA hydrolase [Spirochaetaceae bacterium]|nr:aminoacyl-tRNA hydrolase [Spirochaetaceae bacterium]
MAAFLLMGLGNPGPAYHLTRHNAGFCVLDNFAASHEVIKHKTASNYSYTKHLVNGAVFYCVKPLTYMNLSGNILNDIKKKTGLDTENLVVICDNLDLPLGRLRLKQGGGSAGQKGLQNIIERVGTANFARLYVGIGRPQPPFTVVDYVLGRFPPVEEEIFLAGCAGAAHFLAQLNGTNFAEVQAKINAG